jgi:diguanylate cyclase (GGDEF)-like protein/PAS domain S-box-containing protein
MKRRLKDTREGDLAKEAVPSSEGFTVGFLSPLLAGAYFGTLLKGVAAAVWAGGGRAVAVQTRDTGIDHDNFGIPDYTSDVCWGHIDGFVVVVNAANAGYYRSIAQAGKPMVFISPTGPNVPGPVVVPDNRAGTREAVQHLLDHGHERIAFAGFLGQQDIRERYEGYVEALAGRGVAASPELLFRVEDNMQQGGRAAARAMLAADLPSTAVVAGCDYNALGIIEELKLAGVPLPRRQAIVGFDDLATSPHTVPALASVRQPLDQMGRLAAELVLRQLRGEEVGLARYVVPTELIRRESCGCRAVAQSWMAPAGPPPEKVPSNAAPPARSPRDGFLASLLDDILMPGSDDVSRRELSKYATELIDCLEGAVTADTLAQASALEEAVAGMYRLRPRQHTVEVLLGALQRYRDELAPQDEATKLWLAQAWTGTTLMLAHLPTVEQSAVNRRLQSTMFNEYLVTVALLRDPNQDPKALGWLGPTEVGAACLGFWRGLPGLLEVVGTFQREAGRELPRGEVAEEAFPPAELLESADPERGEVVHVMAVQSKGRRWGALALTSPVETAGMTGMDLFYQWAGLLAASLDREEMLASLQHQADDLEQAVERERELVETVRRSEERYSLAASAASDGLWDWDVAAGTMFYSPRWKQVLGYADDEIGDSPDEWLSRVHPDDSATLRGALRACGTGEQDSMEVEHRLASADGTYLWAHCRALAVPGGGLPARRVVGSLTDITRRRQLEERLRQRALYDALTGLPNRSLFLESLDASMSANAYEQCAMFFVDLDNFKNVNDTLGHDAGDELLVVLAKRIKEALRPFDMVARYGGDEFIALAQDVSSRDAMEIAERLRTAVVQPVDIGPARVHVGCSVGVAMSDGRHPVSLIQQADAALYRAKERGRNRCEIYEASMQGVRQRRADIEDLLRSTVDEGRLVVLYEPIVELASGRAVGSEAVARIRNLAGEPLAPDQFMEVAEESGLVVPLGAAILDRACAQQAVWYATGSGPDSVGVDLSPRQLADRAMVSHLAETLAKEALRADRLFLEISETTLVDAGGLARQTLEDLRSLGVMIAIDDFGSGWSGISHLRRFPVNALKMDPALLPGLGTNEGDARAVNAVISLGHALGLTVVAQGVTHGHQAEMLLGLGCDLAQGPLFGEALPPERWQLPSPPLHEANR